MRSFQRPATSDQQGAGGWWLAAVSSIAVLALLASGIGVTNQFTYDDKYIIQGNAALHSLGNVWGAFRSSYWPKAWGGDGYRPFTMAAFTLEWAIGGGAPWVFHVVNVALYAATSVALFALAQLILPLWAAWLAAALFAVHPVHVEAVANTVGQSELWVALAALVAVFLYVRARQAGPLSVRVAAVIVALYGLACLSKEHGIVLPALLLVTEALVVRDARAFGARWRELRPFALALVAVAMGFLWARSTVLASHEFAGFEPVVAFQTLRVGTADRILTMFGVVPIWIRLFLWPARLSSEYAPPDVEIAQGASITQLPGFLLLCAVLGLAVALWRRRPVVSYGIAWIVIALLPTSNFLVPTGIILAERTLLLPSVGAMLAVAAALVWLAEDRRVTWRREWAVAVGALVIAAGAIRSAMRSRVWHDNDKLFRQAVVDAPMSYRAHYMLGAWAFEQRRKREGEQEYHRALTLFPYDPFVAYNLARQYREVGLCAQALPFFRWAYELDPGMQIGHGSYALCLLNTGRWSDAKEQAFTAIRNGERLPLIRWMIHSADSAARADSAGSRKMPETMQKTGGKAVSGAPD